MKWENGSAYYLMRGLWGGGGLCQAAAFTASPPFTDFYPHNSTSQFLSLKMKTPNTFQVILLIFLLVIFIKVYSVFSHMMMLKILLKKKTSLYNN